MLNKTYDVLAEGNVKLVRDIADRTLEGKSLEHAQEVFHVSVFKKSLTRVSTILWLLQCLRASR